MQHRIPSDEHGPRGKSMRHAVESCVHCGFCLPTCPTYSDLGEEMDSPRGRIWLMKEVLEGSLPLDDALPYVDRCLGCLACEPACPSGVSYGELLTPFRALAEEKRARPLARRIARRLALGTLPYPTKLRRALRMARWIRWARPLFPESMGAMFDLAPAKIPPAIEIPELTAASGERRARVAFLAGCAQQVLAPQINEATLRVLTRNGVEVVTPRAQGCCGALSMHDGAEGQALELAGRTLEAFPDDVDAIITNAAGCGSGMKEYPLLFKGTELEESARRFSAKVMDISVFLDEIGLVPPEGLAAGAKGLAGPLRIAYHDACHLGHAQGVREAPRRLLESLPGVEVVTPRDWEICCGSAGTYNIAEPGIAGRLGERKARNIIETGATIVASGNIGCLTQVRHHLGRLGRAIEVLHTIEVVDRAYGDA